MSVEVVAEIMVTEGKEAEVLEGLRAAIEKAHAEDDGCMLYALHQDTADPTRLVMIEKWASPEALQAHGEANMARFAEVDSSVFAARPRVLILESLGYGDDDLGRL